MIRLLGLPFETFSNFRRGAALAPAHIRWSWWGIDEYSLIRGAKAPPFVDMGDLWSEMEHPPKERISLLRMRVYEMVFKHRGDKFLFLGGDHTITLITAPVLREIHGGFAILHLDAHLDRWDNYGGKYSHATVMRRLEEMGFTIGTFGYRTVGEGEYLPKYGHPYTFRGLDEFLKGFDRVFLSLDLDVLDPSEFPAVGNPEPRGVDLDSLLAVIERISGRLIGAEMVEYIPPLDTSHRCGYLAATLLRELLLSL